MISWYTFAGFQVVFADHTLCHCHATQALRIKMPSALRTILRAHSQLHVLTVIGSQELFGAEEFVILVS